MTMPDDNPPITPDPDDTDPWAPGSTATAAGWTPDSVPF